MSFLKIFHGPSGQPEMGRTLLGLGGANGIISPTVFQVWASWNNPASFDIEKYCLAMSALMVSLAPLLLSIGSKDKGSAVAKVTLAQPPLSDTSKDSQS